MYIGGRAVFLLVAIVNAVTATAIDRSSTFKGKRRRPRGTQW